jgi:hypothetical protein
MSVDVNDDDDLSSESGSDVAEDHGSSDDDDDLSTIKGTYIFIDTYEYLCTYLNMYI